jgi:hypothetical protein
MQRIPSSADPAVHLNMLPERFFDAMAKDELLIIVFWPLVSILRWMWEVYLRAAGYTKKAPLSVVDFLFLLITSLLLYAQAILLVLIIDTLGAAVGYGGTTSLAEVIWPSLRISLMCVVAAFISAMIVARLTR